jgi:hypothetical protein
LKRWELLRPPWNEQVVNLSRQLNLLEFQSEPVEPEIQPFQWNQAKQYTDPEAEDFTPVLQALRDRDRQIEATRFPP